LIKGYSSNMAKRDKNPNHVFKMSFRSKKDEQKSIVIGSKHIKRGPSFLREDATRRSYGSFHMYPKVFGSEPLLTSIPVPETAELYDCRLIKTKVGQFYLAVPTVLIPNELDNRIQGPERVLSLDPGVRSFMTGYSPLGMTVEWGPGLLPSLSPLKQKRKTRKKRRKKTPKTNFETLLYKADQLLSEASKKTINAKKRRGLKLASQRLRDKARNKTKDLHRKCAKWMCENFDVIFLPKFQSQQMVARKNRKIGSKTVRSMMTWRHYSFQQHLLHKSKEYPWVRVIVCTEEYTSQTCTRCGHVHKVGGAKTVHCPQCHLTMDRDDRGARNVYLLNEFYLH
jgi:putative transposase